MILLIDNYDSFAHNLARYLRQLGQDVQVIRNDEWSVKEVNQSKPDAIVISPGPGTPDGAGICLEVVRQLGQSIPILGICLGHQVICQVFGGEIVRAKPMHGQACIVEHEEHGLFSGIPSPFRVGRYHSLVSESAVVMGPLQVIATVQVETSSSLIMAVAHQELPIVGVQFHPESILTEHGYRLLANFLSSCGIVVQASLVQSLSAQLAEQVQRPAKKTDSFVETLTPHGWS